MRKAVGETSWKCLSVMRQVSKPRNIEFRAVMLITRLLSKIIMNDRLCIVQYYAIKHYHSSTGSAGMGFELPTGELHYFT